MLAYTFTKHVRHSVMRQGGCIISRCLQTGIVGLPNVGKSTLFNALVGNSMAQAANYPFCTIEPNSGNVNVPDPRLYKLGEVNKSEKVTHTSMEFVDIAGIVKGASEGAGLGNKFLSNIRNTDAIVQVVRCFEDVNIIHVDDTVDPARDMDVINIELILADLSQIEKRLAKCMKDVKMNSGEIDALKKVLEQLEAGNPARFATLDSQELEIIKGHKLLTMKKVIYAANVADSDLATGNEMSELVKAYAKKDKSEFVLVSAQVESELSGFDPSERADFLDQLGVVDEECGLKGLVKVAYDVLGLQTFYTSGPTETRAWTVKKGATAPEAAGVIHTDFQRGFIRAETCDYDTYVDAGGEKAAKEKGLIRSEGRDYIMKDGDVVLFRFNV